MMRIIAMAYKPWTPVIVGGTMCGDGLDNNIVSSKSKIPACKLFALASSKNDDIIVTSHQELAEYAISFDFLSENDNGYIDPNTITWDYGPKQQYRGERGQFVIEYHDGEEHQTYWVPC